MTILTNQTKGENAYWLAHTALLPGWRNRLLTGDTESAGWLSHILWGWKLFRDRLAFDAVVTGSEKSAFFFVVLQRFFTRRPVPQVLIYTHWNLPKLWYLRAVKRMWYRFILSSVSAVIVYSEQQLRNYSKEIGGSVSKLRSVPYHTTYQGDIVPAEPSDYIFAGGDYTRDYQTLLHAVRGTQWRLVIAARFRDCFNEVDIPPNVEIVTTTHERFMELMAGAAVVVVPLQGGLLHSGGQQTYLNAMALGRPVVVADDCGASEYIRSGVDGFVVQPGNVQQMRSALSELIGDPAGARRIGQNAYATAKRYTPEAFCNAVLDIVTDCAGMGVR